MNQTLRSKVQSMALDFYQGNIGVANSKYFSILDELSKYEPFIKNAQNVLKMQENEDWIGLGDFFYEKM
ncbi:MAG: hypothetical protein LBQ76_00035 [Candidatus Fibromonas sp.]|jgi:phage anti-repressor protein|nr:hypothetical protein [Candidatus Fibromonas sp.]